MEGPYFRNAHTSMDPNPNRLHYHYYPATFSDANTIPSFSIGSSSHYQDYFFDRGGQSTNVSSLTSALPPLPHATGLAISGIPTTSFSEDYAEDIWSTNSVHGHSPLPDNSFALKSIRQRPEPVAESSSSSLATTAEMAIILGPPANSSPPPRPLARPEVPSGSQDDGDDDLGKERRHACTMCHKRYDSRLHE